MKILADDGLPMMSEKEIGIIDELLDKHNPRFCLEWGSGNSTVYFPKKHKQIEKWYAVEHKRDYPELLSDKLERAKIYLVEPELEKYVSRPLEFHRQFDFILVDGLFRQECVFMGLQLLSEKGILLLHDCAREESAEIMKTYKGQYEILSKGEKLLSNGYYAHRGLAIFYGDKLLPKHS